MTGAEFMRIVRSPGTFAVPHIPVIMLTSTRSASACWKPFALA